MERPRAFVEHSTIQSPIDLSLRLCAQRTQNPVVVMRVEWRQRQAAIELSMADACGMAERARKFDVDAGGRFDLRNGRIIILWSEDEHPDGGCGVPIASIAIERLATVSMHSVT